MKFLNRLEYKFGRYAISSLMLYIVSVNFGVYVMNLAAPELNIVQSLTLYPELVMQGQVWRLISYVFIPPSFSMLWILFTLSFYYMVGSALEREWGSFKFNIYYLVGIIGTTASAFISGSVGTGTYLNMSLFLAFACIYPDYEFRLYFVIPVKVKYYAWLDAILLGFFFFGGNFSTKLSITAALINFFIFFGKDLIMGVVHRGNAIKNKKVYDNKAKMPKSITYHRCTICGITEKDNPQMEFRFCSSCQGRHEYCMDHLRDHEHIKSGKSI